MYPEPGPEDYRGIVEALLAEHDFQPGGDYPVGELFPPGSGDVVACQLGVMGQTYEWTSPLLTLSRRWS